MSILYESYAVTERLFSPARVKDTEKTLTITLAAGKGVILDARAYARGTTTVITKCAPGVEFDLWANVRNDGDPDTTWVTAKDKDTGELLKNVEGVTFDFSAYLETGKLLQPSFNRVVMPNKTFNILFEAGHGK